MFIRPWAIVFLAVCVTKVSLFPFSWKTDYRLPEHTRPISYDIRITTEIPMNTNTFNGIVGIFVEVIKATDKIVLHANDLTIKKISLVDTETGAELKNLPYKFNNRNKFLSIISPKILKEGNIYILTISYSGTHITKPRGFFTSSYKDSDGNEIPLATTHFEPTYARSAFPCYDEPALKAKFTIALTHASNYTALSNMPAEGPPTPEENGMVTTKFRESPIMSTYTVAFLITTYRNVSSKTGAITTRVFSPPVAKTNGEQSLDVASKIMGHFEDYFGIIYPLPKMDHISVPGMSFSAMENWGLIIYEFGFLLPTSNSSSMYNIGTFSTITHELGHQWFGNLVTPEWWDATWLNEGLTTFYTDKMLQLLYPQWHSEEYSLFVHVAGIEEKQKHALTEHVETEKQILKTFSNFAYHKAAYILHMFEHALTEKTFKMGISQYLMKHKYSVATEEDLFNSLQEAASADDIEYFDEPGQVNKMMYSWFHQKNYPFVTVERDYKKGTFTLIQSNKMIRNSGFWGTVIGFFKRPEITRWWIPITYATAASPNFEDTKTDIIFPDTGEITVDPEYAGKVLKEGDWLILNKKRIGFYSVNYDRKNWELIIEALNTNPKVIHAYNRAQLIRDAYKFAVANLLSEDLLIRLLSYLSSEDEPTPWYEGVQVLSKMYDNIGSKKKRETFKKFIRDTISKMFTKIGTEQIAGEHPLLEIIRGKMFGLACESDLIDCKSMVEAKFDPAMKGDLDDIYMKTAVFCQYLKNATKEDVENFVTDLHKHKPYPFDKRETEIYQIMSCKQDIELIMGVLNYIGVDVIDILNSGMLEDYSD